jgi:uncharacterized protein (TIGR03118 family)
MADDARGASRGRRARCRPRLESLEGRALLSHVSHHAASAVHVARATKFYEQTNLVSDDATVIDALNEDPNLINPWGLAATSTGPFWVANNGSGVATAYDGDGVDQGILVTIPAPAFDTNPATPTGLVANESQNFTVSLNGTAGAANFLFASEDGTISGWSDSVDPDNAIKVVDNSFRFAVYKGLAMATTPNGFAQLYATNFRTGAIDVFASNFNAVTTRPGAFTDPSLPRGYAPFGITNFNGNLLVSYAKQDSTKSNNVAGKGAGVVDLYSPTGTLIQRVASHGKLNSPWGMTVAPSDFGKFSNDLLIGNFGDGRINAFKRQGGRFVFVGQLASDKNTPVIIDGLWSLQFGNGSGSGNTNSLYFTSGPNGEQDGLFGKLDPSAL